MPISQPTHGLPPDFFCLGWFLLSCITELEVAPCFFWKVGEYQILSKIDQDVRACVFVMQRWSPYISPHHPSETDSVRHSGWHLSIDWHAPQSCLGSLRPSLPPSLPTSFLLRMTSYWLEPRGIIWSAWVKSIFSEVACTWVYLFQLKGFLPVTATRVCTLWQQLPHDLELLLGGSEAYRGAASGPFDQDPDSLSDITKLLQNIFLSSFCLLFGNKSLSSKCSEKQRET